MENGIRFKPGDWVILAKNCTPIAWRGRVARVVSSVDRSLFPYRVSFGGDEMGMYSREILRPATEAEVLEHKLTL